MMIYVVIARDTLAEFSDENDIMGVFTEKEKAYEAKKDLENTNSICLFEVRTYEANKIVEILGINS